MKIQLVVPSLDQDYESVSRSGLFPPLCLLSLGSYLKTYLDSGVDIQILDGTIMNMDEIERRLDGDFVGISANILTYRNAVKLAHVARNRSATTIVGGAHCLLLARQILENRDCFDYVIRGEGERAFYELVSGKEPKEIHNLVFRDRGRIIENRIELLDLEALPQVDRTLVDMAPYWASYREKRPSSPFARPNIIYSQKGCGWSKEMGACVFCGRPDPGWRARDPGSVWREIEHLVKVFNTDYVWDICGSLLSSRKWFKRFKNSKPIHLNPALEIYARADEIDQEIANDLKGLNVHTVFVGIDAGDPSTLLSANKGTTIEQHTRAISFLRDVRINVTMGIVLGLPGEDERTLSNTLNHAERMLEFGNVDTISCSVLIPVPGSRAFSMLTTHPLYQSSYHGKDDLDVAKLQRDWARAFCLVSYERLQEACDHVLSLSPGRSSMGKARRKQSASEAHDESLETGEVVLRKTS